MTSFAYPNSFYFLSSLHLLSLGHASLHLFNLYLAPFHSAGVSLLPGQWFLPVSLAMLSIAGLLKGLSNLGAFSKVKYIHQGESIKDIFPPLSLYSLWADKAHCMTNLRNSFCTICRTFSGHLCHQAVDPSNQLLPCCGYRHLCMLASVTFPSLSLLLV